MSRLPWSGSSICGFPAGGGEQGLAGSRVVPRLLVGDLNMPSTVLLAARQGWPETGHGRTFPNSAPTQQLDHGLRAR